jgi:hypothetical protein
MSYVKVDEILMKFAAERNILIDFEESNVRRRFFHVSSQAGETFQVVIEPETDGFVRVDAHLIEALGTQELHYKWEAPLEDLYIVLVTCMRSMEIWFNRTS